MISFDFYCESRPIRSAGVKLARKVCIGDTQKPLKRFRVFVYLAIIGPRSWPFCWKVRFWYLLYLIVSISLKSEIRATKCHCSRFNLKKLHLWIAQQQGVES